MNPVIDNNNLSAHGSNQNISHPIAQPRPESDSEEEEPDHEPDDLHSVVENHLQNIRQLTQLLTGLTRENSPDWLLNELANLLPTYINLKTRLGRLDPKILENNICLMHLNTQVDEMMVLADQFSIPWEQPPSS
ncbi:unnamed protein product [Allacma fusca]|uniref:Uncharacterized protein n=1 Tax=Allacma fusca TaxID=39272 RepID=A0A8J2PYW6_9HEXA|nr:unnamed protein product [Allacma fusca]